MVHPGVLALARAFGAAERAVDQSLGSACHGKTSRRRINDVDPLLDFQPVAGLVPGDVFGLGEVVCPRGGGELPEVGDGEDGVGTGEGAFQRRDVVEVSFDEVDSEVC